MNDQLNERLVSLMDYIGSVAKDADAFARAQLPDAAREIVAWELWSGVARAVFGVTIAFFAVKYGYRVLRYFQRTDPKIAETPWPIAIVVFVIAAIFGACLFADSATTAIRAVVAPRLVILDYVKGAMR